MDRVIFIRKAAAGCAMLGALGAVLLQTSCGQTGSTAETAKRNDAAKSPAAAATVRYYSAVLHRPLTAAEQQQLAEAAATYRASVARAFGLTTEARGSGAFLGDSLKL